MKRIYAYYNSIPTENQSEQFARANWWKHSWQKQGWEPVMLNSSHAVASNLYGKFQQKLGQTITTAHRILANSWLKQSARLIRWCALHATGGGWMSDYDVVNIGFTPKIAAEYEKQSTIHVTPNKAYLFYANAEHVNKAIQKLMSEELSKGEEWVAESVALELSEVLFPLKTHIVHEKSIVSENNENRSELMKKMCV